MISIEEEGSFQSGCLNYLIEEYRLSLLKSGLILRIALILGLVLWEAEAPEDDRIFEDRPEFGDVEYRFEEWSRFLSSPRGDRGGG